ncbi:hypothetical protein MLD38_033746 [Melastoma candidum]|uniref:Uncharacterized protein n=1 Tax=Melastoma candidum TaxID=119954 RepID=A0ACB9M7R0_9MYRT|nr:hypothetical protein MLD38_033746 [Melastoma candidum]
MIGRRQQQRGGGGGGGIGLRTRWRFYRKRAVLFRILLALLVLIAIVPPIVFHFRLKSLHRALQKKCGWLGNPPLVCAHGGDTTKAFPNTMAAYQAALHSQVDCMEIDVSRTADGVLVALHDRELQQISGDTTSRVGHYSIDEIKVFEEMHEFSLKFEDTKIPTMEDALMSISRSLKWVIIDAKIGPPLYENGLARDILSTIERTGCRNCLVWAKSDNLVREIIRLSPNTTVGYIVMKDPTTGFRTNLFRVRGADVVGVYHPLVDERLVRNLQGRMKKVYAWTVDDLDSMQLMLVQRVDAIVTNNPGNLQRLMQDIRSKCLVDGFLS